MNLKLQESTLRLLELEQYQMELEGKRNAIKTLGLQIGGMASLSVAGMLAYFSLVSWVTAEGIESERGKADPDEKLYDVDEDGDVDRADENHERDLARGLIIGAAIPAAAGIVTTVFLRMRKRARSKLTRQIEKLTPVRRAILEQMRSELTVSGTQAGVDLHFRF
jgi:hypothetical protein